MRKLNTKRTVPLDAVPERRTKRFPPRFRPVGRFCELSFRCQSSPTDREEEISRPLDHMRQIPIIHPARLTVTSNFDIYTTVLYLFPLCGTLQCVLSQCGDNYACSLAQQSFQGSEHSRPQSMFLLVTWSEKRRALVAAITGCP